MQLHFSFYAPFFHRFYMPKTAILYGQNKLDNGELIIVVFWSDLQYETSFFNGEFDRVAIESVLRSVHNYPLSILHYITP